MSVWIWWRNSIHPVLLLWLSNLLSSQGTRVLIFNLAEIDFLFPGPFTQRHLLIYKIVKGIVAPSAIGVLANAIFLSLWLYPFIPTILTGLREGFWAFYLYTCFMLRLLNFDKRLPKRSTPEPESCWQSPPLPFVCCHPTGHPLFRNRAACADSSKNSGVIGKALSYSCV